MGSQQDHFISKLFSSDKKMFAVLIDPDKYNEDSLLDLIKLSEKANISFFFVGGSLMTSPRFESTIKIIKSLTEIPVVIFPGSNQQISPSADAILLLSLISGRNPEYLIGQHVVAAPYIKQSGLEVLPTGYMLIGNERTTTANYISNTTPIPGDNPEIATCTAMAGEMLGLKLMYLDGGSGASGVVDPSMIASVKDAVDCPIIVGGGVTNGKLAAQCWDAGADVVVVGNALEKNPELILEISGELKTV